MTTTFASLPLSEAELFDPHVWYTWRADQNKRGVTPAVMAEQLSASDSAIAHLRIADLLESAGRMNEAMPHLKHCLLSANTALRAQAMALMIFNERKARALEKKGAVDHVWAATHTLEKHLQAIQSSTIQDDFYIESQVILKYNLCRLYFDAGDYPLALAHAAEAIYLSLPLDVPQLTSAIRVSHAGAAVLAGQLQVAYREYQAVSDTVLPHSALRLFSRLNVALVQLMGGDVEAAQTVIDAVLEEKPDNIPARTSKQFIQAMSGLLDPEEEIQACHELSRDVINAGLQALVAFVNLGHREHLNTALDAFKEIHRANPIFDCVISWAQASALSHLGQIYPAAQRIELHRPYYPLIEILTLGLKLELAIRLDGIDLQSPAHLCQQVQAAFRQTGSRSARQGLAGALAYWHPSAAAFCALSPCSVPELVDVALPSVFIDGRPIQIHGQSVPTRLPFLQITLEAFGLNTTVNRDQSSERERMARALTVTWGRGKRVLPVIPPALLAFHFLRMAESHGELWRMAARELARSHGLVPTTKGGNLRDERAALEEELRTLLSGKTGVSEFLNWLAAAGGTVAGGLR